MEDVIVRTEYYELTAIFSGDIPYQITPEVQMLLERNLAEYGFSVEFKTLQLEEPTTRVSLNYRGNAMQPQEVQDYAKMIIQTVLDKMEEINTTINETGEPTVCNYEREDPKNKLENAL